VLNQTSKNPFQKFSTNERKELLTRSLRSKSDRIDIFSVDLGAAVCQMG
jgi:multiple sugar transport system substrate-binding protein